jgi:hypothetical protein
MEQTGINGGSIVYRNVPAGVSLRDLTLPAPLVPVRTLSSNEGASDLIILQGALVAPTTVIIPPSLFPQVVGTDPNSPLYTGLYVNSWIKTIQNLTTGPQPITISAGGPVTAGFTAAEVGLTKVFYSPDGINVYAAGPAT